MKKEKKREEINIKVEGTVYIKFPCCCSKLTVNVSVARLFVSTATLVNFIQATLNYKHIVSTNTYMYMYSKHYNPLKYRYWQALAFN